MILPVVQHKSATVFPLLDCNARCPFCSTRIYTDDGIQSPIDHREGVKRRAKDYTMSLDDLKASYDQLKADGVTRLNLQGGEPTLHDGLAELIGYGRALGFEEQVVVSNGRRFKDPGYARSLVQAHPTTIVLSLFGADAPTHDAAMGVRGAFDDVTEGVRNLVRETPPGKRGGVSLMAQFTLYSGNFRSLPDLLRHWHAAGLRDFTIRLLRETDNTAQGPGPGGSWFFDLAALKQPLVEALTFAAQHRDVFVTFSEVFYCLLDDVHLGFVLGDLASNPNLRAKKVQVTRHFDRALDDRTTRDSTAACATCDLEPTCVKPEAQYRDLLGATLHPVDVRATFERLSTSPIEPVSRGFLHVLANRLDRLAWFGVDEHARLRFLARLIADAAEHEPMRVAELLLSERSRVELRQHLTRFDAAPQVRLLPASLLGAEGPFPREARAALDHLRAHASDEVAAQLEFLGKCAPLALDPLVTAFAWNSRGATGGTSAALAVVFDDSRLDAAVLQHVLDELGHKAQ